MKSLTNRNCLASRDLMLMMMMTTTTSLVMLMIAAVDLLVTVTVHHLLTSLSHGALLHVLASVRSVLQH